MSEMEQSGNWWNRPVGYDFLEWWWSSIWEVVTVTAEPAEGMALSDFEHERASAHSLRRMHQKWHGPLPEEVK